MKKLNETEFLPWNHPVRLDAEEMVRRYNWYCQTHLPSDCNKELASMFLAFLSTHRSHVEQDSNTKKADDLYDSLRLDDFNNP